MGHKVTPNGILPDDSKIKALERIAETENAKALQSFLGFVDFYRKFISNFAKIAAPLYLLLRKETLFTWNKEHEESFNELKKRLTKCSMLINPDFSKTFELTTDASKFAIGGVLLQNNKPDTFISRTLNKTEINYSVIEKDMLAIYCCVKSLRHYLHGQSFVIFTDHKPLMYFIKPLTFSSRLTKWKLYLLEFDFKITYKKGIDNVVADALSRLEIRVNTISLLTKRTVTSQSEQDTLIKLKLAHSLPGHGNVVSYTQIHGKTI